MIPSVILLGFFLGMRHATDPDHVIAVGTIVSREARIGSALLIGVLWGIGHSLTILVVGGMIVLCGLTIPPRLGFGMEFSVGVMLIVLGVTTVGERLWRIARSREDERGLAAAAHGHEHGFGGGRMTPWNAPRALRPFVVGVVHGLAGSAAVALLVVAMIPSPSWAMLYLLVFGLGTLAGMVLVTAATALPFVYAVRRVAAMNRYLAMASGVLSVGFGLFVVYRIGIVEGLLLGAP